MTTDNQPGPTASRPPEWCYQIHDTEYFLMYRDEHGVDRQAGILFHDCGTTVREVLAKLNAPAPASVVGSERHRPRCDHCGAYTIDNCFRCGAPQCCPQCCKIDELERRLAPVAELATVSEDQKREIERLTKALHAHMRANENGLEELKSVSIRADIRGAQADILLSERDALAARMAELEAREQKLLHPAIRSKGTR